MQAFIITAYKDREQFIRLINTVSKIGNVYVHIDKKSKDLNVNELSSMDLTNVRFISKYKIYWGSYNHVRAILDLFKMALDNPQNHFFHVISGQDMPVKDKEAFEHFFDEKNNTVYMTVSNAAQYDTGIKDRYHYYYPCNNGNPAGTFYRLINRAAVDIQKLLHIKRNAIGKFVRIFKGMVWVSMPYSAAEYAIQYLSNNPEYLKALKSVKLPEEFLFQTIILNSEHETCVYNGNLRYTDWEHGSGGSPAVLDESAYDIIRNGDYYFARKIDSKRSEKLIERLCEKS